MTKRLPNARITTHVKRDAAALDALPDLLDVHDLVHAALGANAPGGVQVRLPAEPLPLVIGEAEHLHAELRRRAQALTETLPPLDPWQARVMRVSGHVLPERPASLLLELAVEARAERIELPLAGATPLL